MIGTDLNLIYLLLPLSPFALGFLSCLILKLGRANEIDVMASLAAGVGVSAWAYFVLALAFTFTAQVHLFLSLSLWCIFLFLATVVARLYLILKRLARV